MTVFVVDSAPQRLRGMLGRYCLEVRAGLYVGKIDARLRATLWEHVEHYADRCGAAVLIWRESNEQGYAFRSLGDNRRMPIIRDGLWLIDEFPES
jgi:CRISPR-associated protein Cas2